MTTTTPPTPKAPISKASMSKVIRITTVMLDVLQFQAVVHGAVVDQSDPLVSVCNDGHPPARIRRADKCSSCGVSGGKWNKAQEVGDGLVVLSEAKLAAIKAADEQFKEVISFSVVQADSTYLVPAGSSYCLAPRSPGSRNYGLIAAVVKRRPKLAFIGEFSFGGAPKLFRLEVDGDGVLILREIARPEAIRQRPQIAGGKVSPQALAMAEQLVDDLAQPFDPAQFVNRHAQQVTDLIAATPAVAAATSPAAAGAGDILAQLQARLDALKGAPTTTSKPAKRRRSAPKTTVETQAA